MRLSLSGASFRSARHRLLAAAGVAALGAGLLAVTAPTARADDSNWPYQSAIPFTNADNFVTSSVNVTAAGGSLSHISVAVKGLKHSAPGDIELELVGPTGIAVSLMSDSCTGGFSPSTGVDLTFDSDAATGLPAGGTCGSDTVQPTDNAGADSWPVPLPAGKLTAFAGINPIGTWTLYARDKNANGSEDGTIGLGYSLSLITAPSQARVPTSGYAGPASYYPIGLSGGANQAAIVTDVNVTVRGVNHSSVGDIDAIIVSPSGTGVWLTSDACSTDAQGQATATRETNATWVFDEQAAAPLPQSGSSAACTTGSYRPSNNTDADADSFPTTATAAPPAGPYGTTLAAFDGQHASGQWRLYVTDDHDGSGGGYLAGAGITITTNLGTVVSDVSATPDTTAPQTRITHRPKRKVHRRHASFTFVSTEAGSTFQCKVDHKAWKACTPGVKIKKLGVHRHRFKVRAIDATGNVDQSPATARWRVLSRHQPHRHHPDTHQ